MSPRVCWPLDFAERVSDAGSKAMVQSQKVPPGAPPSIHSLDHVNMISRESQLDEFFFEVASMVSLK